MTLKDLLNIEGRPKVNVNGTWYDIKCECAKGILVVPSMAPYWENPPIPGIVKMEIDMILADYRSSSSGKYFDPKSIFLPSDANVRTWNDYSGIHQCEEKRDKESEQNDRT